MCFGFAPRMLAFVPVVVLLFVPVPPPACLTWSGFLSLLGGGGGRGERSTKGELLPV